MNTTDDVTGPINLGNPVEFTILDLAERVLRLANSKSKLVYKDLPVDDPKRRRPDVRLAKERLGWVPSVEMEEGLARTVAYFDAYLHES